MRRRGGLRLHLDGHVRKDLGQELLHPPAGPCRRSLLIDGPSTGNVEQSKGPPPRPSAKYERGRKTR